MQLCWLVASIYQSGFPAVVLQWLLVSHQVVECSILHEGCEDKDEAHRHKEVHGCDVGNTGKVLAGDGTQCGHC